jgi:ribonucleoside-diphosphate reductase alpha chain
MRVDHPEILNFINYKKDNPQDYQFFNFSVFFTDEQFENCYNGEPLELHHKKLDVPVVADGRIILETMARNGWKNGDPSPYFIDRANRVWKELVYGKLDPWGQSYGMKCTHNPCGEQCLPTHGVCNLASINLFAMLNPITGEMHEELFERCTRAAIRFLDGVVDKNWFPDERITLQSKHLRNIGLGFMGLADYFYLSNLEYGSKESVAMAEIISRYMTDWAWSESRALGKHLGVAPVFEGSEIEYRNSDVTCIAPTGSISLLALANGGLEPYFSTFYEKLVYPKGEPDVKKMIEIIPPAIIFFEHDKKPPKTAMKIDPYRHVDVLAAVSRNVTNAVSKTVNLPNEYSVDNVIDIYNYAFTKGCTSVTIFRDGCREDLALVNKEDETVKERDWLLDVPEEERAAMLKREPFDMDKMTGMEEEMEEILGKDFQMVSNSSPQYNNGSEYVIQGSNGKVGAVDYNPNGVSAVMVANINNGVLEVDNLVTFKPKKGICEGCGSNNVRVQEGCYYCNDCPWSACSTS